MAEKESKYSIRNNQHAAIFFGTGDENFRYLKEISGADMSARGADIYVRGPEEQVDYTLQLVADLMEIVEPLWPRFAKMWVGENQTLRDHLGQYQDLQVLKRLTGPGQPLVKLAACIRLSCSQRLLVQCFCFLSYHRQTFLLFQGGYSLLCRCRQSI